MTRGERSCRPSIVRVGRALRRPDRLDDPATVSDAASHTGPAQPVLVAQCEVDASNLTGVRRSGMAGIVSRVEINLWPPISDNAISDILSVAFLVEQSGALCCIASLADT